MAKSIYPTSKSNAEPTQKSKSVSFGNAGAMLEALSCDTSRRVVEALQQTSDTPSGLAEKLDISIQVATYHLTQLQEAGLIEVIDTCYSARGREMQIYTLAAKEVVLNIFHSSTTTVTIFPSESESVSHRSSTEVD